MTLFYSYEPAKPVVISWTSLVESFKVKWVSQIDIRFLVLWLLMAMAFNVVTHYQNIHLFCHYELMCRLRCPKLLELFWLFLIYSFVYYTHTYIYVQHINDIHNGSDRNKRVIMKWTENNYAMKQKLSPSICINM